MRINMEYDEYVDKSSKSYVYDKIIKRKKYY